jgi:hypothetical protein
MGRATMRKGRSLDLNSLQQTWTGGTAGAPPLANRRPLGWSSPETVSQYSFLSVSFAASLIHLQFPIFLILRSPIDLKISLLFFLPKISLIGDCS